MLAVLRLLVLTLGLGGLVACVGAKDTPSTTAASPVTAAPGSQVALRPDLAEAVTPGVIRDETGGDPLLTPASFKPALETSLADEGYLAPQPEAALYAVEASLLRIESPETGEFIEVSTVVAYSLVRLSDGTVVLNRTVAASYTAATFEEAADGSIRASVAQFVGVMSETYAAGPGQQDSDGMTLASAGGANADRAAAAPGTPQAALQQEFDAWLFANREAFESEFSEASGKPGVELQQVNSVRALERTADGYVAEVTYRVGGTLGSSTMTNRFLFSLDERERLADIQPLQAI